MNYKKTYYEPLKERIIDFAMKYFEVNNVVIDLPTDEINKIIENCWRKLNGVKMEKELELAMQDAKRFDTPEYRDQFRVGNAGAKLFKAIMDKVA